MHPRTLLRDDVKSEAEVKVFETLRDGLDDGWEVFHSVGWVQRDPAEGAQDGEVDFVLCHPAEAVICLEVKGGDLECRYGEWSRRGERAKDPFQQALDHKYALKRLIATVNNSRANDLLLVHAVALPDVPVHSLVMLGRDDVPPTHIAVLSSHGKDKSGVHAALAGRLVDERAKARNGKVLFSSIRAFKGLESPVVVLCELEDIDDATRDAQLYVGMSRARNHCVIVAPNASAYRAAAGR
jgi:hypothetical protein